MIIRKLRPDENDKCKSVMAAAFNFSVEQSQLKEQQLDEESFGAFCDDGETLMGQIVAKDYTCFYGGKKLGTLGIAGVSTLPQYRRSGCIREVFSHLFSIAPQRGWAVSYLYPFSFDYYRKFGYERIHLSSEITFPMASLSAIERNGDGVLCLSDEKIAEVCAVYNAYAKRFDGMLERQSAPYWSADPFKTQNYTYLFYTDGKADGYVCLSINNGTLRVREMVYDTVEGARRILGFLRMYEGQVQSVAIGYLGGDRTLEYMCGEFRRMSRSVFDGAMGRVLDAEAVLAQSRYSGEGRFVIGVTDRQISANNASFEVRYSPSSVAVSRTAEKPMAVFDARAFSLLMLSDVKYSPDEWNGLFGVMCNDGCDKVFGAFADRKVNLTDQF